MTMDAGGQTGWEKQSRSGRRGWKAWALLGVVLAVLAIYGFSLLGGSFSATKEAPEAELILAAQANLPFQVLIPAYLPAGFKRANVQVDPGLIGPGGEPMIQIRYPGRGGSELVFSEWLPAQEDASQASPAGEALQPQTVRCRCQCRSRSECDFTDMEVRIGALHVLVKTTAPGAVTSLPFGLFNGSEVTAQQMQFVLNTMGPAANQQIYSSMSDVPLTTSLPEAVDIPVDGNGVQAITLVVTPQGYTPAHFAVKKGVPVRVVFRQVGEVGCGNELVFQWGQGKSADLRLASADDVQTLEFTPNEAGTFAFHCPHFIYNGGMTVRE
jgi:hypothetical protein